MLRTDLFGLQASSIDVPGPPITRLACPRQAQCHQSLVRVTGLARAGKARARLGRPSLAGSGQRRRSTRHARHPASRWSASADAQAGSGSAPRPGKAKTAFPAPGRITPHPPRGGYKRPSNITQVRRKRPACRGGGRAVLARQHPPARLTGAMLNGRVAVAPKGVLRTAFRCHPWPQRLRASGAR